MSRDTLSNYLISYCLQRKQLVEMESLPGSKTRSRIFAVVCNPKKADTGINIRLPTGITGVRAEAAAQRNWRTRWG
jgi:hypothetical protein